DDFYEAFFNWPQLYLLGGADDLLAQSELHWEGVTAQLTELGMLSGEYERGYDWFHQGESLLPLYFLTMASPSRWAERAVRFAELYVDPAHGNYDPARRIIRRPHNGSDPSRTGLFDGTHYPWLDQEARCYGFPLDWRWYGGHYGWSWPHGWYSVGSAAMIAALAAATATGDDGYLDLVRPALDTMTGNGKVMAYAESDSSLASKWYPQLAGAVTALTLLVPYRHGDRGWFDYNPMLASVPVALWH